MKRKFSAFFAIAFALLVLAACPPAHAQFTQVSGTITDPNGLVYANGTITPSLVVTGGCIPTVNGQPYSPPANPVGLSSAGNFSMQLAANSSLCSSGSSTWSFTVTCGVGCIPQPGGTGPITFTVTGVTISGSSQSLSSTLSNAAPPLSNASLPIYTVATLPTGLGTAGRGKLVTVKDGSTSSDCTTGGGTNAVACIWTGSAWAYAGSASANPNFSQVAAGTNTNALVVGSGGSIQATGSGIINATECNGGSCGGTGTVTSITASTGLSGGTITGSGTIAILTAFQLPQSCSNGQVPIWGTPTGSQWNCGAAGTGTVTGSSLTANNVIVGGGSSAIQLFGTGGNGAVANLGTITTNINPFNLEWTENSGSVAFGGEQINVTDTAHGSGSYLFQVNGGSAATTPEFQLDNSGNGTFAGGVNGTSGNFTGTGSGLFTMTEGPAPSTLTAFSLAFYTDTSITTSLAIHWPVFSTGGVPFFPTPSVTGSDSHLNTNALISPITLDSSGDITLPAFVTFGGQTFSGVTGTAGSLVLSVGPSFTGTTTLATTDVTAELASSGNGNANAPALVMSGNLFTGGTGTTTVPFFGIEPNSPTAVTNWSTSGTIFGMDIGQVSAAPFAGNIFDIRNNGTNSPTPASIFKVDASGNLTLGGTCTGCGANTALSNLSGVSINTSLLAQTNVDLGSTSAPFRNLYLFGTGTFAADSIEFTGAPSSNRVVTFPDNTGTAAELNLAQTFSALQTFGTNISIGGVTFSGGVNGSDTKVQTGTGTFSVSNIACGDVNGGVTPCTTLPSGLSATNLTLTTPALGTPSSGNASNLTSFPATGVCLPGTFTAQTDGSTVTWAIASAICANASLTFTVHSGSRTLNLTGLVTGGSYVIKLIQDGTGGENLTGGTGCTWKQSGGGGSTFTLTATANAIDVLSFVYDGTNCLSVLTKAYS